MKICLSYSVDNNYIPYVQKSIASLNTNSPEVSAFIDLIDVPTFELKNLKNTLYVHSNSNLDDTKITIKNKTSHIIKERKVSIRGAYANLRKVYNIYNLLKNYNFDYVINMDADNLIIKNMVPFFESIKNKDYDLFIKFAYKGLLKGKELEKRKNNFKNFDNKLIDLETQDLHFREGCMIVKNTTTSQLFFKDVSDNILSTIAWYGDSFWMAYAYKKYKNTLKIFELPSNFIAYDIYTETNPIVVSGYDENKYSKEYLNLSKEF